MNDINNIINHREPFFQEIKECEGKVRQVLIESCMVVDSIEEIYQLYRSFKFNLSLLTNNFLVMYSDHVTFVKSGEIADLYTVNTLLSNIISSGKNLVERIRVFFDQENTNNSEDFNNNYYIKEYDECFSYRFLSEARNIMQHGHYIVSVDSEGKFGFDFQQILSVPHFNIKKKMKGDMEHYQKLFNKITDPEKRGRLAFTYTIDKYCISLIRIYLGYYQLTKDYLHILIEQLHNIMANNPQLTLLGEEKKILMFRLDNDTHFLNIDRPYYEQFLTDMKEAEMFLAFLIKQTGDNTMKFINVEDE